MNSRVSYNIRRTLVAILVALISLLVVIPLMYDWAGVRSNLEEFIAPTLVAQKKSRTRLPRTPTPNNSLPPIAAPSRVPETPLPQVPLPTVAAVNGVPIERLVLISDSARVHIRDIYALGQSMGRDPRAVSKIGDSTMIYPPFLTAFDGNYYRLGQFAYLQETIEFYSGSFGRESAAVKRGIHTWSQFDPQWAIPELCGPNEGPLECEIRLHNPSIAIIRLGANDTLHPSLFERNLGAIVKYCLARGIIPVLGTKPDRYEGESNLLNNIIRKTASAYSIPLWDYDLIAGTVPGRGLEPDGLHIRNSISRDFGSPGTMRSGDALGDLSGLMILHAIHRELGVSVPVASR
jgi:hypothetical protein